MDVLAQPHLGLRRDHCGRDLRLPRRTYLCADARRSGKHNLAEQLRWRTLAIGAVTGSVVFAALIPLQQDAPTLADGLETQAAPLVVISALADIATLVLVAIRRFAVARVTALAAVAAVVTGWGVGQYPWLLVDQVTITDAAGARPRWKRCSSPSAWLWSSCFLRWAISTNRPSRSHGCDRPTAMAANAEGLIRQRERD